ncbi:MAG: GGDEF domain-containing protein [Paraglaciecola sp.]|nr:GGDEF domain-containing protein [Paraglaciecola sp.]
MEQLSPFYDEGISDTRFNLEHFNQGMSQTDVNQFMHKLLSTIDLSRLSEVYFQQLQVRLRLESIDIQFAEKTLSLGSKRPQTHPKTLSCLRSGDTFASIHYGFNRALSVGDWQILQQMHMYFCNPLNNALEHYKLKQFAMKDFLTSLGNRASYDEALSRLISQAERHQAPFGLLVLDLDNFKQVNDQYGHNEGDKVLIAFTQTLLHCLRDTDFAFRFGGDEFCCLLPDTTAPDIQVIAERIKAAVTHTGLLRKYNVSCSIGSTLYQRHDVAATMFARADSALYQAKQNGRNCIKVA